MVVGNYVDLASKLVGDVKLEDFVMIVEGVTLSEANIEKMIILYGER